MKKWQTWQGNGKRFNRGFATFMLVVLGAASAQAKTVQIKFNGTLNWVADYWTTPTEAVQGAMVKGNLSFDSANCAAPVMDQVAEPISGGWRYACPTAVLTYSVTNENGQAQKMTTTGIYVWSNIYRNAAGQTGANVMISTLDRTLMFIPFVSRNVAPPLDPNFYPIATQPWAIDVTLRLINEVQSGSNLTLSLPGQAPANQATTSSSFFVISGANLSIAANPAINGANVSYPTFMGTNVALFQLKSWPYTTNATPVQVAPIHSGTSYIVPLTNTTGSAFFDLQVAP